MTATGIAPTSGWYRRRAVVLGIAATAVLVAAAAGWLLSVRGSPRTSLTSVRATGTPSNVPTGLANLMGLSPVPEEHRPAPGFTLTDQHGTRVSLSDFRGHPVVLTFLDPHCVTMCPIIAQEFVDAERHLLHARPGVVFLSVNVNRHALGVATVEAFTKEHRLNTIPTWHFLTGTLAALQQVWSAYGIEVETRIVHGQWTVVHSTIDFFIGPDGEERYIASPNADYRHTATHRAYLPHGTFTAWGHGIALVAQDTEDRARARAHES